MGAGDHGINRRHMVSPGSRLFPPHRGLSNHAGSAGYRLRINQGQDWPRLVGQLGPQ